MVFDWENWWAVTDACAVDNDLDYREVFLDFFRPLWEMGVDVDMIDLLRPDPEHILQRVRACVRQIGFVHLAAPAGRDIACVVLTALA